MTAVSAHLNWIRTLPVGTSTYLGCSDLAYSGGTVRFLTRTALLASISSLLLAVPAPLLAHDIKLPLEELQRGVSRVDATLSHFRTFPAVPPLPQTDDDQRRILGSAEIALALGNHKKALG